MKGSFQRNAREAALRKARYERAKRNFDLNAAFDLVEECLCSSAVDALVDAVIGVNQAPLIIAPHPEFDPEHEGGCDVAAPLPTNAIPFAFAARLATELGCDVDEQIVEVNRPGRSKLNNFQRFRWQPAFTGEIQPGRSYIIVDDVCTMASTLAMLRSYIVAHGGTVIAATTLAHTNGCNQLFPIAPDTVRMLRVAYSNGFDDLWREEIGYGSECLTDNEGHRLLEWGRSKRVSADRPDSMLQLLRDRLAQVSEKGG